MGGAMMLRVSVGLIDFAFGVEVDLIADGVWTGDG
jgi:hypothetical protein